MTRSRPAQSQSEADLSEAARAVVHDEGDPRIDAHLAALGLGPGPAPALTRRGEPAPDPAELQALRDRVAALELEVGSLHSRTRRLATAVVLAVVAVAALVILLLATLQGA
jgi:hypothetical protein